MTRLEYELALFEHEQAGKVHEREQKLLNEFRIRAPFSGYVAEHLKHVGDTVDQLEGMLSKGWRPLNDDPVVTPTELWTDDYIDVLAPMAAKRANRKTVQ